MKKFRFSLAALLSLRKERTQECEFLLAGELGKLAILKNQIENAGKARDNALSSTRTNLDELRMREHLLSKALSERRILETRLLETEKSVEKVRSTYLEARSKSAALEKLRNKRRNYWKSAAKQEETRKLDEIAKRAALRPNVNRGGNESTL